MNKKIYAMILTVVMTAASVGSAAVAKEDIKVSVNGRLVSFDQPPIIQDGRTLVPMRAIFETLGAEVEWDKNSRTVLAKKDGDMVEMMIGSTTMAKLSNGAVSEITLDVAPQIVNDRTLVPARAVAEALGCSVKWDGASRTVIIARKITSTVPGDPAVAFSASEGTLGVNAHENFYSLFDSNSATKWCVTGFTSGTYVIWGASEPIAVTGYTIVTGNDTKTYEERNPKSWTLYGCNCEDFPSKDNPGWGVIDNHTDDNILRAKNEKRYDYKLLSPAPTYQYYMLVINEVTDGSIMQISEFMLDYSGRDYTVISDKSKQEEYDKYAPFTGLSGSSDSSGGSSSGGSVSYPSTGGVRCTYCNGTGTRSCNTCGGKGYKEDRITTPKYPGSSSGGTKVVRKNCPNSLCHGGQVDCSFCGGDGVR